MEQLTRKSDGWYKGCGCGQKTLDKVIPPEYVTELFFQHEGTKVGPVSGIEYKLYPNVIAIDIDTADAVVWLNDGTAKDGKAFPGFKGTLTRVTK